MSACKTQQKQIKSSGQRKIKTKLILWWDSIEHQAQMSNIRNKKETISRNQIKQENI